MQSGHAANYKEDMFVLEVCIFFCHVFFSGRLSVGCIDAVSLNLA